MATLEEIRPSFLAEIDDKELLSLHRRTHQWYANAKRRGGAIENIVHAHHWIVQEMERRGFKHNKHPGLDFVKLPKSIQRNADFVIVPHYVSVVGSAARHGFDKAHDIDILIRESPDAPSYYKENLFLLLRRFFDPKKTGKRLHLLFNPQGPHDGAFIPLFDLVLRQSENDLVLVKSAYVKSRPVTLLFVHEAIFNVEESPVQIVELAPGMSPTVAPPYWYDWEVRYLGSEFPAGPQDSFIPVQNLETDPWPLPDEWAHIVIMHHVLEHFENPVQILNRVWDLLKPDGKLIVAVPTIRSPGAFVHPEHKSFWSELSFIFLTDPKYIDSFHEKPKPFVIEEMWTDDEKESLVVVLAKALCDFAKAKVEPIMRLGNRLPHPRQAGYTHTDAFSPDEIWPWVERHLDGRVFAEPKLNGYRAAIQKKGKEISIQFDGTNTNRYDALLKVDPNLKRLQALPDAILDCNIGVEENGKPWPRPWLATLNSRSPDIGKGKIDITCFDVMYWDGEVVADKPFVERREFLEKIRGKLAKANISITPIMEIKSKADLEKAWKSDRFGRAPMSEGVVLKAGDWVYEFRTDTDGMAKLKHDVEIKAKVVDVKTNANGTKTYLGAVDDHGEDYPLGWTMATKVQASKGDIITVAIQELIESDDGSISWLGARVMDKDDSRSTPYKLGQVVELARRGNIYQPARPNPDES